MGKKHTKHLLKECYTTCITMNNTSHTYESIVGIISRYNQYDIMGKKNRNPTRQRVEQQLQISDILSGEYSLQISVDDRRCIRVYDHVSHRYKANILISEYNVLNENVLLCDLSKLRNMYITQYAPCSVIVRHNEVKDRLELLLIYTELIGKVFDEHVIE